MNIRNVALTLVAGAVLLSTVFALFGGWNRDVRRVPRHAAPSTIGVVHIEGPIAGGASGGSLLGAGAAGDDIVKTLRDAAEDPSVAAIVLRLNTPGGSAAASQEIGSEIKHLRDSGKVVVASMGDMAASGGYWLASAADHIVANPASLTGSIGVIMQLTNMDGLYEKLGIDIENITSGEHKDMGSRELSEEERRLMQAMVDDIFHQFVEVVAEGRGVPVDQVLAWADGRLFTGRQAFDEGLVDELGSFNDAVRRAADMAGLGDDFRVRNLGAQPGFLNLFFGTFASALSQALPAGGISPESAPTLVRWVLTPDLP